MIKLEIDSNLVTQTRFFHIDRKVQLIIDEYNNKEKDIKTRISQKSLLSPILFLIYISSVFNKVFEIILLDMFLLFVNELEFITLSNSIKELIKILKNVTKVILEWENLNVVTYNISKSKVVVFLKLH